MGFAKGNAHGKAESVLAILETHGPVPNDMRNTILRQTDLDILKLWLLCAAQAESFEDWKDKVSYNEAN